MTAMANGYTLLSKPIQQLSQASRRLLLEQKRSLSVYGQAADFERRELVVNSKEEWKEFHLAPAQNTATSRDAVIPAPNRATRDINSIVHAIHHLAKNLSLKQLSVPGWNPKVSSLKVNRGKDTVAALTSWSRASLSAWVEAFSLPEWRHIAHPQG